MARRSAKASSAAVPSVLLGVGSSTRRVFWHGRVCRAFRGRIECFARWAHLRGKQTTFRGCHECYTARCAHLRGKRSSMAGSGEVLHSCLPHVLDLRHRVLLSRWRGQEREQWRDGKQRSARAERTRPHACSLDILPDRRPHVHVWHGAQSWHGAQISELGGGTLSPWRGSRERERSNLALERLAAFVRSVGLDPAGSHRSQSACSARGVVVCR